MYVADDAVRPVSMATPARGFAWVIFGLVLALMVVNFVDRQVVVSMFPHLAREWALSDRELGALASIVALVVALLTIPLSYLVDRLPRLQALATMGFVWSAATMAGALAASYAQLLTLRGLVGVGEAAYGAAAAALVATLFPERQRSTMLAAFLSAALLGSVLGVALGGVVATRWGWRTAFMVAGAPGLALALALAVAARSRAGRAAAALTAPALRASVRQALRAVSSSRTLLMSSLATGAQLVMVSSILAWTPSFLVRYHGLAPDMAALVAAALVSLSAGGSIVVGALADRATARMPRARPIAASLAALASALFLWPAFLAGIAPSWQLAALAMCALVMGGTIGPSGAMAIDVAPASLRVTFASVAACIQGGLGLATGPILAGVISDRHGLAAAFKVLPFFSLLAAGLFVVAARHYLRDVARARG